MGLYFWGGFASGMSKSIEQNRDRKAKDDAVREQKKQDNNKLVAKQNKDLFDIKSKSEKRLAELQDSKRKVMGEDYEGTEETRVDTINEINGQMFDVYKSANSYAAGLGKDPIVDISGMDVGQLSSVNIDGQDYVVPQDLAATIVDSDGKMKLVGNEVHQAVYENNSMGQPVIKKDENGNTVYESSGTTLRKYEDVFKPSTKGGKRTVGDVKREQYDAYTSNTANPKSYQEWEEDQKNKASSSALVDSHRYSKSVASGETQFDEEEALEHESSVQNTKAFTTSFQKKVEEFNDKVVAEQGYDELHGILKSDIESGLYNTGLIDSTRQAVAEYIGSDLGSVVGLSGEEISSRLKVDTKIGDTVARYVKLISGAAATDAERANLTDVIFGSKFKNEDARLKKFESFIQSRKSENQKIAKSISGKAPYTAGKYLYKQKSKTPEAKKVEKEASLNRQSAFDKVKEMKPNWSDDKISRFLQTKGY